MYTYRGGKTVVTTIYGNNNCFVNGGSFNAFTVFVGQHEGHPDCKIPSAGVLGWLYVSVNVQICIWPS